MLRQYVIATRLVSIIQTVQLSRETGILIAKRGEGTSVEEGRIVFSSGRITEVKTSRSNISDAFNHLSTWENCLVSFFPQDASKDIHIYLRVLLRVQAFYLIHKSSFQLPLCLKEHGPSMNVSKSVT